MPFIEQLFFADNSAYVATLKTLAIFSVGYLIRPLGGIFFSHFGDRHGRKVVFLATVIFMAIPSFAIGMLPTTAQIGYFAPLLLLMLRMMQGLALGGEIPASITFVSEHVPDNRRGIALAILFFGINLGLLLGSLVTTIMTSILSQQEILAYGWRIPFILGGFFGIISIFLRRYLHETAAFKAMKKQDIQRMPVVTLMRDSYMKVLQGFMLVSLGSVTVFLYLYWPQYLHEYMHYDLSSLMRINTIGTLMLNAMILIGGLLTDHFGARNVFQYCAAALVVLSYPLFSLFEFANLGWVLLSYFVFAIIFGCIPSAYSTILSKLFPTPVRYSGIAMSYNLAYAIVGGLSPVLCTIAIQTTGSVLAPAWYIMFIAILAGSTCLLNKTYHSEEMITSVVK